MSQNLSEGGIETFGPLFQKYTRKVKKALDSLNHDSHDIWHKLEHEFKHELEHAAIHHGTHHLLEKAAENIIEMMKHPQEYKDAIKSLIVVGFIAKEINSMAEYVAKARATTFDTIKSTVEKMRSQPQSEVLKSVMEMWKEPLLNQGEHILSLAKELTKRAKKLLEETPSTAKETLVTAEDLRSIVKDLVDLHSNIALKSRDLANVSKVDEVNSNEKDNPDHTDRNNNSGLPRRQSSFNILPVPGASWRE